MNFQIVHPPQKLVDYVRFFWFFEGCGTRDRSYIHRILAEPCPEIIFYYKGQFKRHNSESGRESPLTSGIYGQTQSFNQVATEMDFGIFGIYLFPYTLPQLFRLSAAELTNKYADFKALCGKEGEILEERIMLASTNYQRVLLASDFLTARLKYVKREYASIMSSIKEVANSSQLISVESLARNCCLSIRQLERKFNEFSGFSPKLFLQLVRFNSVIKEASQNKSLTQIAYQCGYYDQSHFIHEFQKFSGYSPKEYFRNIATIKDYRATREFKQ